MLPLLRKLARGLHLVFEVWPRRAGFWLGWHVGGPVFARPVAWVLWQVKPLRPRLTRWALREDWS